MKCKSKVSVAISPENMKFLGAEKVRQDINRSALIGQALDKYRAAVERKARRGQKKNHPFARLEYKEILGSKISSRSA